MCRRSAAAAASLRIVVVLSACFSAASALLPHRPPQNHRLLGALPDAGNWGVFLGRRRRCVVALAAIDDMDLEGLTVPLLKDRLRAAGLPVSGRKADLMERLRLGGASSPPVSGGTAVDKSSTTREAEGADGTSADAGGGSKLKAFLDERLKKRAAAAGDEDDDVMVARVGGASSRAPPAARQGRSGGSASASSSAEQRRKPRRRNPGKRERMARRAWTCTDGDDNVENPSIANLLSRRDAARRDRDFDVADEMLERLMEEHGVRLDDAERTWSRTGGPPGMARGGTSAEDRGMGGSAAAHDQWTRRGGAKNPLPDAVAASILAQIEERDGMRRQGRYDDADDIRDDLLSEHGVRLDDKDKVWWTGPIPEADEVQKRRQAQPQREKRSDGGGGGWKCANDEDGAGMGNMHLPPDVRSRVEDMVRERDAARSRRDFITADATRDDLRDTFGVQLDDDLRLWWTSEDGSLPEAYLRAKAGSGASTAEWDVAWTRAEENEDGSAANLSGRERDQVEALLAAREDARRKRNYAASDRIRDDLREKHDVHLDDGARIWTVMGGGWGEGEGEEP